MKFCIQKLKNSSLRSLFFNFWMQNFTFNFSNYLGSSGMIACSTRRPARACLRRRRHRLNHYKWGKHECIMDNNNGIQSLLMKYQFYRGFCMHYNKTHTENKNIFMYNNFLFILVVLLFNLS